MHNPKKDLKLSSKQWLIFLLISIALLFVLGVPTIYSDSIYYYHVTRSLTDYGTFTSPKEPEYYDYRGHGIAYYNGKYSDVGAVGTSLINLPGIYLSQNLRDPSQTIYTDYFLAVEGHTFMDGLSQLLTAFIFGIVSFYLTWKIFFYYLQHKLKALLLSIAIFISSFVIFYFTIQPGYTHVYEYFCSALIIYSLLKLKENPTKYSILLSIASALGFLVRPTFALISLFSFINLIINSDKKLKAFLIFVISHIPFLTIYFLYNLESYGSILASGYNTIRGENFVVSLESFNLLNVLFSPQRGWFVYSPLLFLGFIGLLRGIRVKNIKTKTFYISLLTTIILMATAFGFWPSWWGGGSYGARFLIGLTPLVIPGLIQFKDLFKDKMKILVVVMVVYSASLNFLYLFTPIATLRPQNDRVGIMYSGDRYTPLDIYRHHFNLLKDNLSNPKEYITKFVKSFSGGNTLLILSTGITDTVLRVDEREEGIIKFKILEAPISIQPLPSEINFYIRDKSTSQIYQATLNNAQAWVEYEIRYQAPSPYALSKEITIKPVTEYPEILNFNNYRGFRLNNSPLLLYFEQTSNIRFAAPPLIVPYYDMEGFDLNYNY
jgi:hypothetical protein